MLEVDDRMVRLELYQEYIGYILLSLRYTLRYTLSVISTDIY